MYRSYMLLVLCSLSLMACKRDDEPIDNAADFDVYLEDEMDAQHIPALATLVFEGDEVLYQSYLGESNVDEGLSLKSDHLFLLASISKTITATALLRLYDQGLFELDDPINNYLPFEVNVPGYSRAITFKMLLTHTSAIADGPALDDQYYYGKDSPTPLDEFLESYLVPGGSNYSETENFYDFEPGTEHEYSNEGSALIAVLVQEISGKGFNAFCKEEIFDPLGMDHTSWRLDEINGVIVQPYEYKSRSYDAIGHYTFTDYPNGGLRSTAQDMHRFFQAFANGGMSQGYSLLSAETVAAVLKPQIPGIDEEVGLHMFIMDADLGLWGHDGGEQGVATIMAFNPSTKVGAIVLANQGDAALEDILAEAYEFGANGQ